MMNGRLKLGAEGVRTMANMTFEIKSDNIQQAIKEKDERVERALVQIGLMMERYAQSICPVDTGRLRNSITNDHDDTSVIVGTNVEYAPYVEYGTSRQRAQPYLKPSVQDHLEEYKSIIENSLKS